MLLFVLTDVPRYHCGLSLRTGLGSVSLQGLTSTGMLSSSLPVLANQQGLIIAGMLSSHLPVLLWIAMRLVRSQWVLASPLVDPPC